MTQYTQHPLSAAFPALSDAEYLVLKDSITMIGVQNPITLFEGMVIDGWHRYSAARELDMDCPSVELGDVDPRDFVMAQNKARRHTTQAQLALATTAVYAWKPMGSNQHQGGSAPGAEAQKSAKELAKVAGVGVRSIEQAKVVRAKASPEIVAAIKQGDIGLPKAAAIAKLPPEQQAQAIHKPMSDIAPAKKKRPVGKPKKVPAAKWVDAEISAANARNDAQAANARADALEAENRTLREAIPHGTAVDMADRRGIDPAQSHAQEPPPAYTALEAAQDTISDLQAALAIASMGDAPEADRQRAQELIAELQAEVKSLAAQLLAANATRDALLNENAQIKKQLAAQRREIDRLKKQAGQVA